MSASSPSHKLFFSPIPPYRGFLLGFVLFLALSPSVSYAHLTDEECDAARSRHDAFSLRLCEHTLSSEESGDLQFAMAALWLGKDMDKANDRLRQAYDALLKGKDDQLASGIMTPEVAGRAKWAMRGWLRIYYTFGPRGGPHGDRLHSDLLERMEDLFWNYGCLKSTVERTSPDCIWFIQGSENHDMMDLSNAFLSLQAVKNFPRYRDRPLPDGHTATEHCKAWTAYYKLYCEERARWGLFAEVNSPTYGKYFVPELVNMADFAEDSALRKKLKMLLDLAWTDWAIDELGGVRGGAKTRVYQGHYAQRGASDSWSMMGRILTGQGDWIYSKHYEAQYVLALSPYRLPNVVLDLALSPGDRGRYVYRSLRPAKLGHRPEGELEGTEGYWMEGPNGRALRYSFCTPSYIMGSWILDPNVEYAAIHTQNRWQGILFSTDQNARVFPQCEGLNNGKTYRQHWAVQHRNVLIVQKNRRAKQSGKMRVFFSPGIREKIEERDGCFLLCEAEAYLALRPLEAEGAPTPLLSWQDDHWAHVSEQFAPLVFVGGTVKRHGSLEAFAEYVASHQWEMSNRLLLYSFSDDEGQPIELSMDIGPQEGLPLINGQPVELSPHLVFDSPYIQSRAGSGRVTIQFGERKRVLNFLDAPSTSSSVPPQGPPGK